jgi:hypothetical protein
MIQCLIRKILAIKICNQLRIIECKRLENFFNDQIILLNNYKEQNNNLPKKVNEIIKENQIICEFDILILSPRLQEKNLCDFNNFGNKDRSKLNSLVPIGSRTWMNNKLLSLSEVGTNSDKIKLSPSSPPNCIDSSTSLICNINHIIINNNNNYYYYSSKCLIQLEWNEKTLFKYTTLGLHSKSITLIKSNNNNNNYNNIATDDELKHLDTKLIEDSFFVQCLKRVSRKCSDEIITSHTKIL